MFVYWERLVLVKGNIFHGGWVYLLNFGNAPVCMIIPNIALASVIPGVIEILRFR